MRVDVCLELIECYLSMATARLTRRVVEGLSSAPCLSGGTRASFHPPFGRF